MCEVLDAWLLVLAWAQYLSLYAVSQCDDKDDDDDTELLTDAGCSVMV